ncbi:hypothetical protein HID58_086811, partial [Brassica napus]
EVPLVFLPCFPNCHSKINKWLYSTSPMLMKLRGMQEFKVRKGIAEEAADSAFRLTKITNDLSKGKGHIVDYLDPAVTTPSTLSDHKSITNVLEEVAESSAANGEALSAPVLACSDFQMAPSSGGRVTASSSSKKNQRRRPPSWKRKTGTRPVDPQTFSTQVISTQQRMKRKSSPPPSSSDHKTLKITKTLVASSDGVSRGRFFFDNRMVGKEGVEDAVRKGWCKEMSGRQVSIIERISRCRRELSKWKKCSTSNAKVNIQRLQVNFPGAEVSQIPHTIRDNFVSWSKHPTGFLKCNVGISWVSRHVNCGVAWILRDNKGKAILHSRHAFSNVESQRDAELIGLQWGVKYMVNTHQRNIIFDSSCALARDTFLNMANYMEHVLITNDIKYMLCSLQDWSFHHSDQRKNTIAQDIAESVTSERRYQFYIAFGAPSWLSRRVESDAGAWMARRPSIRF